MASLPMASPEGNSTSSPNHHRRVSKKSNEHYTDWKDPMVKALLSHMDSHSGPGGMYDTDPDKALELACVEIAKVTPAGVNIPNAQKAARKLERLSLSYVHRRYKYTTKKYKLGSAYFTRLPQHLQPIPKPQFRKSAKLSTQKNVQTYSVEIFHREDKSQGTLSSEQTRMGRSLADVAVAIDDSDELGSTQRFAFSQPTTS